MRRMTASIKDNSTIQTDSTGPVSAGREAVDLKSQETTNHIEINGTYCGIQPKEIFLKMKYSIIIQLTQSIVKLTHILPIHSQM